jgi:hypothetical protein
MRATLINSVIPRLKPKSCYTLANAGTEDQSVAPTVKDKMRAKGRVGADNAGSLFFIG